MNPDPPLGMGGEPLEKNSKKKNNSNPISEDVTTILGIDMP